MHAGTPGGPEPSYLTLYKRGSGGIKSLTRGACWNPRWDAKLSYPPQRWQQWDKKFNKGYMLEPLVGSQVTLPSTMVAAVGLKV